MTPLHSGRARAGDRMPRAWEAIEASIEPGVNKRQTAVRVALGSAAEFAAVNTKSSNLAILEEGCRKSGFCQQYAIRNEIDGYGQ